jgi:hypothetical protein
MTTFIIKLWFFSNSAGLQSNLTACGHSYLPQKMFVKVIEHAGITAFFVYIGILDLLNDWMDF